LKCETATEKKNRVANRCIPSSLDSCTYVPRMPLMRATSSGAGTVPGPRNARRHAASSRWSSDVGAVVIKPRPTQQLDAGAEGASLMLASRSNQITRKSSFPRRSRIRRRADEKPAARTAARQQGGGELDLDLDG
jgi:hypothetical protein